MCTLSLDKSENPKFINDPRNRVHVAKAIPNPQQGISGRTLESEIADFNAEIDRGASNPQRISALKSEESERAFSPI